MSDLMPVIRQRYFDQNGVPLAGGFLWTYIAGTTTPLATYTDETGLTPNPNPVVLDSTGSAEVWLGPSAYKFFLTDSLGDAQYTVDNVYSLSAQIANSISGSTPIWNTVSVSYSQLQAASTTNSIPLFTMPAKTILKSIVIKHSTAFSGGSITDVNAQVGPTGSLQEFIENFDILQTVADQAFDNTSLNYIGSFASQTIIYLNAIAVGANLSALTQGSLTVYYELATL